MKRALFLILLAVGFLTLLNGSLAAQTWRLTDNSFSDSLPKITVDNSGHIWVAWLSNIPGNYDIYCRKYDGAGWCDTFRVHADDLNQRYLVIENDLYNNRVWFAWDTCSFIQGGQYINDTLKNVSLYNDSTAPLLACCELYQDEVPFFLAIDDSGKGHLSWSSPITWSPDTTGLGSVVYRNYDLGYWNAIETILIGSHEWPGSQYTIRGLVINESDKPIFYWSVYSDDGVMRPFIIGFKQLVPDSIQENVWAAEGAARPIALVKWNKLYVFFHKIGYPTSEILCMSYIGYNLQYDSCQVISDSAEAYSMSSVTGAVNDRYQPHFVWNDRGAIYVSKLIGTLWSKPQIQISDTSLHDCINPDIVAENDSIVWVCYQNEGDIYVTRTTIPTGVAGKPEQPTKKIPVTLAAYPNPSRGVVRFERRESINSIHTISIYDVSGRRVTSLDGDVWDGRDQGGRPAAPGVYFARMRSGTQTSTIKLTIIK